MIRASLTTRFRATRCVPRITRRAIVILMMALVSSTQAQEVQSVGPVIGTWAFNYPHHGPSAQPLLDLRYLNEKEAGQSGFVQLTRDGNGFALGDGTPVRFWAVGSEVYRQSPGDMAQHVRFLARIGVNLVRLHTQLAPKQQGSPVTGVDTKEIDGIWRFVAAAKKEGIYTIISPYWATGKAVDGWGIEGYSGTTELWGLLFYNEALQRGYKEWVRALYTRPTLIRESHLPGIRPWPSSRSRMRTACSSGRRWGSSRLSGSVWGGSSASGSSRSMAHSTRRGRRGMGWAKKAMISRRVRSGLLSIWPMTQPQTGGMAKRVADEVAFYAETQRGFYADMVAFYRDTLGCRQLINACNWKTADPIKLEDIERWTYTAADVIAVNRYYNGGAHTGGQSGWRIDPGDHFSQQSALLNPRELPINLKQVVGHPMIVSESTWVSPLAYQSEGPFLVAVYQSLTGMDAFIWFTADQPEYALDPTLSFVNLGGQHPIFKWSASIPAIMGGFPAAALMFRMGYIQQGAPVVHEERTISSLWNRDPPIIAEDQVVRPEPRPGPRGRVWGTQDGSRPAWRSW